MSCMMVTHHKDVIFAQSMNMKFFWMQLALLQLLYKPPFKLALFAEAITKVKNKNIEKINV